MNRRVLKLEVKSLVDSIGTFRSLSAFGMLSCQKVSWSQAVIDKCRTAIGNRPIVFTQAFLILIQRPILTATISTLISTFISTFISTLISTLILDTHLDQLLSVSAAIVFWHVVMPKPHNATQPWQLATFLLCCPCLSNGCTTGRELYNWRLGTIVFAIATPAAVLFST